MSLARPDHLLGGSERWAIILGLYPIAPPKPEDDAVPLFAVSLTFSLKLEVVDAPEPIRELAIHVVSAADDSEAIRKGEIIGRAREISYLNGFGEIVHDRFERVVEVQSLSDDHLFDGMEVSAWLYQGDRLILEEGWIDAKGSSLRPSRP